MGAIHNQSLVNELAGSTSSPNNAQSEQDAAASGQIQGQGTAPLLPVASAAVSPTTTGAKDGVNQVGSITQAQRNAIGGTLPRGFGPTLPSTPSQGQQSYQSQHTQLNLMKSDATFVGSFLNSPQGEPSQAELMNTLSKALNNEYKTSFEANRIAGLASVNAKQAEVRDTMDEVHGERIHAAEQLGAAFGSAATQGLTALKGASLMGSMGSEKSKATNNSALNKADEDVKARQANGPHTSITGRAADDEAAATREAEINLHHSQDARRLEASHARSEQNEGDRSSIASNSSRSDSDLRTINTAHDARDPLFGSTTGRTQGAAETASGTHPNKTVTTNGSEEVRDDVSETADVFSNPRTQRAVSGISSTRPAKETHERTVGEDSQGSQDKVSIKANGDSAAASNLPQSGLHKTSRTMGAAEMRGEALKAAAQGLGAIVQNSADLVDKMAGGQHEADQAKIAQKQDQVNAQVAQNNQEMAKGNKEQTSEAIKNMYQAMITAIQRKQDMLSQIAGR